MAPNKQTRKSIRISSKEKLINLAKKVILSRLSEYSRSENNNQKTETEMQNNKTSLPLSDSEDDVVFIGCTKPRYTPTEMARTNKEAREIAKAEALERAKAEAHKRAKAEARKRAKSGARRRAKASV